MIWFEHCSVKVNFNVQGSDTKTFFGLWIKSNVQDWSSLNMTALPCLPASPSPPLSLPSPPQAPAPTLWTWSHQIHERESKGGNTHNFLYTQKHQHTCSLPPASHFIMLQERKNWSMCASPSTANELMLDLICFPLCNCGNIFPSAVHL